MIDSAGVQITPPPHPLILRAFCTNYHGLIQDRALEISSIIIITGTGNHKVSKPTHITTHERVSQGRVALLEQGKLVRVAEEHLAHCGRVMLPPRSLWRLPSPAPVRLGTAPRQLDAAKVNPR